LRPADALRPVDVPVPPTFFTVPEHVGSYGPEVADWADSAGLSLDAEQRLVLDALYAYGPRGELVATEAGVVCARQNLKTHVLLAAALADLFLFDEPGCMWTAHMRAALVDPNSGAFSVCKRIIDANDHLRRYVAKVSEADGEEGIELLSGASLAFRLRSGRAGRALTGRRITLDEALYLDGATLGAMVPVLAAQSAKADVQLRYGSSAGKRESAVLRAVRDRGRVGAPRLTYAEWMADRRPCADEECQHAPGTDGCALDDVDLLRQANPALGRRIALEFVLGTERAAMTPVEFMRERLSWWEDPAADGGALDVATWALLEDPRAERGAPTFGVATAPDRSWSAVGVAWRRPDGLAHVMLADYRPGAAWVPERVDKLRRRWGGAVLVDTASRGLVEEAEEPSQAQQAQAHNALADAVEAGLLRHSLDAEDIGGGGHALTTAVRAARWKPSGDTRVLDRKGSADISPLIAVALAHHGLSRRPVAPPAAPVAVTTGDEIARLSEVGF
jgi:hypothetical protein